MNQEKINSLTEGLARALTLVDAVGTAARQELGYEATRYASQRAVRKIEELLTALQENWAKDERESSTRTSRTSRTSHQDRGRWDDADQENQS